MQIVLLILVAGVWAVFLLPSFLHSRREAPIVSTQEFARGTERLNVVRALANSPALVHRRRIITARRRALTVLSVLAVITLGAAIVTSSMALLGVNIAIDILLGVYTALLVQVKQRASLTAPIRLHAHAPVGVADMVDDTTDQATVRVLAGSVPSPDFGPLDEAARHDLDSKFAAREIGVVNSRKIIRACANSIRALHRDEADRADELMAEAGAILSETKAALQGHPDILTAGFVNDAAKEFAEARTTAALLRGEPVPLPADLDVSTAPYLNGLGETVGELRRRLLDKLRVGELAEAETLFEAMESIHDLLASLDYPDGMTGGLRRTTDVARALIERSRADLTSTIVQERLRRELAGEEG